MTRDGTGAADAAAKVVGEVGTEQSRGFFSFSSTAPGLLDGGGARSGSGSGSSGWSEQDGRQRVAAAERADGCAKLLRVLRLDVCILPLPLLVTLALAQGGEGGDGNGREKGSARSGAFVSRLSLLHVEMVVVVGGSRWRAHLECLGWVVGRAGADAEADATATAERTRPPTVGLGGRWDSSFLIARNAVGRRSSGKRQQA